MAAKKHSTISILTGVLSLMMCWFFWIPVYGIIITVFTMALSVTAIITGRKFIKLSKQKAEVCHRAQMQNARYGLVLGFIGIFMSVICFIAALLFTLYYHLLT